MARFQRYRIAVAKTAAQVVVIDGESPLNALQI